MDNTPLTSHGPLEGIIQRLESMVHQGSPPSDFKGVLTNLREQSELLDGRLKTLEFEVEHSVPESTHQVVVAERDQIKKACDLLRQQLEEAKKEIAAIQAKPAHKMPTVILSTGEVRRPNPYS